MDALRKSLGNEKAKPAAKKAKKRAQGQGEMLLPISGSNKGKAAAKEAAKPAARRKAG
jgi:DNA end-binding protein Ku